MPKSTADEVERRVEEILPLVAECLSLREIRMATVKGTSWGAQISEVTLRRYVARARARIKEAASIDRKGEIGAAKLRCERVIAKAAAKGDLRSELAANRQLAELFALNEPQRSKVEVSGQIDIGAARAALTELLAKDYANGKEQDDEDAEEAD